MRIKVHCQNRVGILRDILNLLVDYGINVNRGEVGGEQGNAIYLLCPNLINLQFQSLKPKLEAIPGVFGVKRVGLMPSERRHLELNALLAALDFPVLSIDMAGQIVAGNRAAAQLLGVRVDEVPGIPLARYAEDLDLPELVRANKARINGLRVKIKGDVFLADIAPLQSEHDESEALAGAVLTLHRADRVGERIYNVRKHELRGFDSIFQSSRVMAAVVREARRMAPLDAPLLIEGETGTGKELLARACHLASPRGQAPFMALNCAGLPESMAETELFGYGPGAFEGARPEGKLGLLELTAGGTLFLDGVGEMSPRLQAKLLRFLQDGCFRRVGSDEEVYLDVRVICATQVDLSELCAKGEFRQDLYHRLNVLSLHIPPLRECLDGLTPLVEHFLDQASRQIGCPLPQLAPQAMDRLGRYHWPGNVRQLENVLFQAVSLCEGGTIKVEHIRLPDYGAPHPLGDFSLEGGLDAIVGRFERAVLERLYREHPSSRLLGKRLGVSHTTIANKLRQHGLGQGGES
ncbi:MULTISPECIES: sigma-54-dependent phenylalanine hydroxylase transcriptional regulator PhhR [Pseudomonas]|jgi:transcriptional regulator of aroF, aroG, tyrA and aromatic amino acid transport|uniref:HTH-type transcriptional regulatory protein TyrR n=1 Tax=Pseudomonas citronellolis TaxID=53408 RepID=A0AAW6PH06_9PSED|nr:MULTISPECIES: sigma-54-dependent phenylalanine hydroxylase transcriptional regulator PhhR [Pseudomonas]KWR85860.1 AAA family ATPase [Pseudomonas sp. PI1]MDF3845914.1 sigma-54-dependent phenylalanine hydroxylase transcriptional regulator PhhR [Pseudomonas citronellolis]UXJ54538.1 sigma-54-dependent phenylalanine hydroxylase transcriptional regulator PhhR [Pseudomonas citronellolis]WAB92192.1 sigma-54-dependent phenylalanine hydroxylase transcriptional regulator PhhR [Pseudomonas citronellolis